MREPGELNRVEGWVAERAVPIFVVLAVLIVLGAGAVFFTFQRSTQTERQVNVIRPQVTKINRSICDRQSLSSEAKARRCAEKIRVGLVNCRKFNRCRAAFLAVLTYPPPARQPGSKPTSSSPAPEGGDAFQPSNHGHQHPGPVEGPPAPSPPPPAPAAPPPAVTAPGNSGEHSQGNGPPHTPPGQEKHGVEVEACAAVVCVEVGVGQ